MPKMPMGCPRDKIAEMIGFVRLGAADCANGPDDARGFSALVLLMMVKPPVTEDEIDNKMEYVQQLRGCLGQKKWWESFDAEMREANAVINPQH